jgi:chromosome segregation ATPase
MSNIYSARMRKYADDLKAKQLAENLKTFEAAKAKVEAADREIETSYGDFLKFNEQQGARQQASNESLAKKYEAVDMARETMDQELLESQKDFEAIKAEFAELSEWSRYRPTGEFQQ